MVKIFANHIFGKQLVSRKYTESLQFNNKKTNNPALKMDKNLNRHFFKENIQMINKDMKRYSSLLAIRKVQIKTTMNEITIYTHKDG